MSIKDAAVRFGTAIENELIQIRADQMEMGQQLTERINSVANDLKDHRRETNERLDRIEQEQAIMKDTQNKMLEILIDIQRRIS